MLRATTDLSADELAPMLHYGFVDIEVLYESDPDFIGHDMARISVIARRGV